MDKKIGMIKCMLCLSIIQILIGRGSLLASDSCSDDESALLLSPKYMYGHDHPTIRTIRSLVSSIKVAFEDIERFPDEERGARIFRQRNQVLELKSLIMNIQLEENGSLLKGIPQETNEDYKYIIKFYTQYFSL